MADDIRFESLDDRVSDLERTLYGNSREKNGGGLYGRVSRLESDFKMYREEREKLPAWVQLAIAGGILSLTFDVVIVLILISLMR